MTKTNVQVGALALKVFTDAIHHDEALKPEWRVPERLHADMVEALADLRALLERAEAAEQERDALKVQLDDAIEVSRSHTHGAPARFFAKLSAIHDVDPKADDWRGRE